MGIEMYDDGINALFIARAKKAKRMVFFPQCGNSLFVRFVGLFVLGCAAFIVVF